MAKETDGQGRTTMNEADLEYLRNINTRPGPNAGRSIDPTKPGPDAALAQSDAKPALPQTLRDAAENLLIAIGMDWDLNGCAENLRAALAQSDAEPVSAREDYEASCGLGFKMPPPRPDTRAQSDAKPVADEDAVNAAFDKWAGTQSYGRVGNRHSFHAGVEFGLRHAVQSDAEPSGWQCKARGNMGANDPQDCDWPVCGCDPYADKVIAALDERAPRAVTHPDADPIAWREALEQQLSDLVELARDTRSDKGRPAQWTHPVGSLVSEFAKRIASPRPDASAGLIEAAEWHEKQIAFYRDQCRKADADLNIDAVGRYDAKRAWHESSAKYFRTRAADRSDAERDFESKPIGYRVYNAPPDRGEPADYIPIGGAGNGA